MRSTKKAFFTESLVYLIGLIVIIILFAILYFAMNATKQEVTYVTDAELMYKYPPQVIHAFLEHEIDVSEDGTRTTRVKDLLKVGKAANKAVSGYRIDEARREFIAVLEREDETKRSSLDYYKSYSKDEFETGDLIHVEYSKSTLPKIGNILNDNNYYFAVQDFAGEFTIVYFKQPCFLNEVRIGC